MASCKDSGFLGSDCLDASPKTPPSSAMNVRLAELATSAAAASVAGALRGVCSAVLGRIKRINILTCFDFAGPVLKRFQARVQKLKRPLPAPLDK